MSSNINSILVPDCLLRIFWELPLHTQLCLRLVCTQWKSLIESGILPQHHSLKLFGTISMIKDTQTYSHNVATFPEEDQRQLMLRVPCAGRPNDELIIDPKYFNQKLCHQLVGLLPNLERLVVFLDWNSPFRDLPTLLDLLPGLKALTLLGSINYDPIKDFFLLQLVQAINRMARLEVLDLLPVNLFRTEQAIQVLINRLPDVLPRLTQFSVRLFGYRGDIEPVLRQLGPGLRKLRLDSLRFFQADDFAEAIRGNPHFRTGVTHLRVSGVARDFVPEICDLFRGLKYLDVGFCGVPELENILIPELNQLEHLRELRLDNLLLDMSLRLEDLFPVTHVTTVHLTGLDLGEWNFSDERFLLALNASFPQVAKMILRCVNSIDEKEMFGAFEFAPKYLEFLKPQYVRLEKHLYNRFAGRFPVTEQPCPTNGAYAEKLYQKGYV